MNCPKCGLQTVPDQKFCRSCGAGLQMTTQPLAGHPTISERTKSQAIIVKAEGQRPNAMVLWGFIMMFVGAAIGVIGKKLMHDEIVTVVGVLVSLAGMFLTAYPYLLPSRHRTYGSGAPSQPEELTESQPKYLPPVSNIEYVPSITERTTNLLERSPATTPSPKEDRESQA